MIERLIKESYGVGTLTTVTDDRREVGVVIVLDGVGEGVVEAH
jgi:hypothetical protein